jgi:hypothetical protein
MTTDMGRSSMIAIQRKVALEMAFRGIAQMQNEANQAETEWERGVLQRDADAALDALVERTEGWDDGYGRP